ncbi:16S rRNA (uracil(1498)-N(3))-methyltransferase [Deinococcus yavapaiensis]|uniref:16S rRNA (uracil(1498)-N(3))-methyltransferase n=1 Tax=Deinococcus yavapaiensis TaxID=309889 RepID=UPI000DA1FA1A|nr:16S rRNA (uracil(1498)-N(3))-methyltransferase [Deinococcus yavapaiensis]
MHRVRVDALDGEVTLGHREVRHLRVLRLTEGDEVRVFDGKGREALAVIRQLDDARAILALLETVDAAPETPTPITLAVALLKGDKLSDVVRASTELGVTSIQLLSTRFADVPDISAAKLERLRRVAAEASKQSRRAVVPDVLSPIKLADLPLTTQGYVAHPGSSDRLADLLTWTASVTLVSGPEGGFHDDEIDLLLTRGYRAVTLGKRILRAETAPLALLGAIVATGV